MKTNHKLPPTIASIRYDLRNGQLHGNPVEALKFLLTEYDKLWSELKIIRNSNVKEYTVEKAA